MSNYKQSSVDILCQKLANKLGLQAITFYIDHQEEIAEAKAMHKEQMIHFAETMPKKKGITQEGEPYVQYDAEQYYNKTYGGNK